MTTTTPFWQTTALADMTPAQWESLCDGCGLCCLQKLEDEDNGEVYYTDVACPLLDTGTGSNGCRCTQYADRAALEANCILLTPQNLGEYARWLPDTCGYKRVMQGQPLASWHPLVSGDRRSVHTAGISAGGRCVSASTVDEDALDEHIVYWVSGFGE